MSSIEEKTIIDDLISIVIPTLNEADIIVNLINDLQQMMENVEIIVVDGGSTDSTVERIKDTINLIQAPRGRALQMNAGAAAASGSILWFLHADCIPPHNAEQLIRDTLKDDSIVGGGFRWGLLGEKWYYGLVTICAHIKNQIRRNLFGDMGVFVRAKVFNKLGGFANIPFLEDVEFNNRLKKQGKTVIVKEIIYSSDRRLLIKGPIRTFIRNHVIKTAYKLGCSPNILQKIYYSK